MPRPEELSSEETDRQLEKYELELAESKLESELSLVDFIRHGWQWVDPVPYVHGKHTEIICAHLEAMARGELTPDEVSKVLFNIPPGHQKSLTVCVFWPAWCWGPLGRPELRFMFTSYRGDLALRDADRSRQLIKSVWYQKNWGDSFATIPDKELLGQFRASMSPAEFELIKTQDSKGRFGNSKGGYRYSTSIAGIMGEGGDFVILDDPHNVEQAESADVRKETIRKLDLALPTRVRSKTGGIVVIMQRLHQQDYSGHVLTNEPGEWQHICLPAEYEVDPETGKNMNPTPTTTCLINPETGLPWEDWRTENGEILFPALFDQARLAKLKAPLGVYGVSGQLQQRPTPRSGTMFDRADLERNVVEAKNVPTFVKTCRAWDLASTKDGGDYTAHVKASLGSDGLVYFTFAQELREKSSTVRAMFDRFVKHDGSGVITRLPQDPGQAGKDQAEQFVAAHLGYPIKVVRPTGDKETRAEPVSSAFQIDKAKIVEGPWNDTLIERLSSFPAPGAPDDVVDAAADAYNELTLGSNYASGQKIMNG